MSQSCSCPVCGRQGLPADCASCPQCDSDLTCFQVLDSLSSNKAEQTGRRFSWRELLAGAAFLLLLAVLAAVWQSKVPGPLLTASQDRQAALPASASDGKIHIDAQIRILDDRQERENRQHRAAQSVAIEEKKQVDKPAQEEVRQMVPDEESSDAPAAQETVAPALPEQTEQADSDSSVPEPLPVELSEPVAKKAVAAASAPDQQAAEPAPAPPPELPVLQGRRKRAVRTRAVSGLREAAAKSANQKNSKSTLVYHAQNGETVWELAERFYGEGKYYPLIMELNPQVVQGRVRGSDKVRLLADRRQAAALYQRSTEQRDGLLLWKHKVQPGETWQSIYARFFPPKYSGMVFYPGDQKVVPGSTVRIILR